MSTDSIEYESDMTTMTQLFSKLKTDGGCIVSSGDCGMMELARAWARGDVAVDEDGFGYVLRPPVGVDELAQVIRKVDGKHTLGAGALAEAILENFPAITQQSAAVDEAMVERAWVAFCENTGTARQGIRAALTAALDAQPGGSDNGR